MAIFLPNQSISVYVIKETKTVTIFPQVSGKVGS